MGFIERLRQLKEAEAIFQQQDETKKKTAAEQAEAEIEQKEAKEKEFHRQRSAQAQNYFQESQVETLVTALAEVTQGKCLWHAAPEFTHGSLPSLAKDPDSASFGIIWDIIKKGSESRSLPVRAYEDTEGWDKVEGKFFEVETQPNGNIIFHARRDIMVPESKWRVSQDILESALEQAYYSARTQRYNNNFRTYRKHHNLGGLG